MGMDSEGFDKWAGDYDLSIEKYVHTFPFDGYYEVLAGVQSLVEPIKNLKVLDVGIGTALLSAELYKKGCIIYGIDFSPEMIKKAKEKIPEGIFEIVNISKNHFGRFNNIKFDRIISSYFFHHLNMREKILFFRKSIKNNLLPGGKIIIADIGFESLKDYNSAFEEYKDEWDPDEYYLCGEEIVSAFKNEGIKIRYKQISFCGGILVYK